jgi:hypothetical protein
VQRFQLQDHAAGYIITRVKAHSEYDAALTAVLESTSATHAAILVFDDAGVLKVEASCGLSPEYQGDFTAFVPLEFEGTSELVDALPRHSIRFKF